MHTAALKIHTQDADHVGVASASGGEEWRVGGVVNGVDGSPRLQQHLKHSGVSVARRQPEGCGADLVAVLEGSGRRVAADEVFDELRVSAAARREQRCVPLFNMFNVNNGMPSCALHLEDDIIFHKMQVTMSVRENVPASPVVRCPSLLGALRDAASLHLSYPPGLQR
eukprot:1195226-Prorocentrum_minimum.AAC.5